MAACAVASWSVPHRGVVSRRPTGRSSHAAVVVAAGNGRVNRRNLGCAWRNDLGCLGGLGTFTLNASEPAASFSSGTRRALLRHVLTARGGAAVARRCTPAPPMSTSEGIRDAETESADVYASSGYDNPNDPDMALSSPRGSPASTSFTVPETGTGVVSWQPHMAWLFNRLSDALGPMHPVDIPQDLAVQTVPGKAQAQTWVYASPRARRVRFTYVDAGHNAQIFNCVVYPRPEDEGGGAGASAGASADASDASEAASTRVSHAAGDAPLLGVDLLCLAGGKKILVGLDLQPLSQEAAYLNQYTPNLIKVRDDAFGDLNLVQPSKKFYEDAEFFSPAMLFARPEPAAMAHAAAKSAAAAAGADFPAVIDDKGGGLSDDLGVELLQVRVLDAVKTYTEAFLKILDVGGSVEAAGDEADFGNNVIKRGSGKEVSREENEGEAAGATEEKAASEQVAGVVPKASANVEAAPEAEEPMLVVWDDGEEEVAVVEPPGELENTAALQAARVAKEEAAEHRGEGEETTTPWTCFLSPLETAAAHDRHDEWQRARDPAVPMFAYYFGKEWAERMAHEVLFPEGSAAAELKG